MASIRPETLSPFGRLALRLDQELSELARVGERMAGVDLDTDAGFDEGLKLLDRAAKTGTGIGETMQAFALALQAERDKAEAATKLVAERAQLISKRGQEQDRLLQALTRLKEEISAAGAGLTGLADKETVAAELGRLRMPMNDFIEAAGAIKAEAARSKLRRVERQAESVVDSLSASLRKIGSALPPPPGA